MKKLFLLLSVVGLAFASCEPNERQTDCGGGVLGAGEFEMSVTNITELSATLKITPKGELPFYWNIATEAELAEFASSAAFMQDYYNYLAEAVDAGMATWPIILDVEPVEYTTQKLAPNTKYILWAMSIDANGNLVSTDLTYVKFKTPESSFDPSAWYGYWDVTSSKHISIGVDPFSGYLTETVVDEPLTKTIAIAPGEEGELPEGMVWVYGFDGVFDLQMPTVAKIVSNKLEIVNAFVLLSEQHETYGNVDYTWLSYSWIESLGGYYTISGSYAPYTFAMAADGSASVTAYSGTITTGDAFMTDYLAIGGVITEGEHEGAILGFSRQDGQPALYLSGENMTAAKVGELEPAVAQKLSKKVKAAHKMTSPKVTAKLFSSAVRFSK